MDEKSLEFHSGYITRVSESMVELLFNGEKFTCSTGWLMGTIRSVTRRDDTERRKFAAMAMQGMLSDSTRDQSLEERAEWAVKMADALLNELAK